MQPVECREPAVALCRRVARTGPTRRILLLGGGSLAYLVAAGCGGLLLPPHRALPVPDLKRRRVTVAVLPDYLRFSRVDPNTGEVTGWDHDLICITQAGFEESFPLHLH
ncbi:MAG TPA: hypothetical protein VMV94_09155 [Phycisphaerae bacterium]|nr:hypothetical protein [Phycisphaerae bacterium]